MFAVLEGDRESSLRQGVPVSTVSGSVDDVVDATATAIKNLTEQRSAWERRAVGVALGGHVDAGTGTVVRSNDFRNCERNWTNVPLARHLADKTGWEISLVNDANALALHSRVADNDDNPQDFAAILIGKYGVGCGLIVNGQLVLGSTGVSGEIGHLPMALGSGTTCRCGSRDCLERVVSGAAIATLVGDAEERAMNSGRDLTQAKEEIFRWAGAALGHALVAVINLVGPSSVVLHGPDELVAEPSQFVEAVRETAVTWGYSNAGTSCHINSRGFNPMNVARGAATYARLGHSGAA